MLKLHSYNDTLGTIMQITVLQGLNYHKIDIQESHETKTT